MRDEIRFWEAAAKRLPLHKFLKLWLYSLWLLLTTGKTVWQTMAQEIERLREVERQRFFRELRRAEAEDWHREFGDRE